MSKRKDDGKGVGKEPSKPSRIPAWQELVNLLRTGTYFDKAFIVAKLKAAGYDVDKNNVSYVMTSVRKNGKICVCGDNGYTATPNGHESLVDIRKRRRVSIAWLENIDALIKYVEQKWSNLIGGMDAAEKIELGREIKYNKAAISMLRQIARANGLK